MRRFTEHPFEPGRCARCGATRARHDPWPECPPGAEGALWLLLWLVVAALVVLAAAVAWHVWSAGHCVTLPGGHLCELP